MKTARIYLPFLLALLFLTGCDDYLDVVPKNDIRTIESDFEEKESVDDWLKTCYTFLPGEVNSFVDSPGFLGADEFVGGQRARNVATMGTSNHPDMMKAFFIGDGVQMSGSPYFNIWAKDRFYDAIRYCNIFIKNCPNCGNMTQEEKTLWMAEVKALKANCYFELFRRYGPIVLVPQNLEANSAIEDMQQPRQPVDSCVNAIVRLCDEAIPDLPHMIQKSSSRYTYYNKEAVATLKAYALLYAASPLFNGNSELASFTNKNDVRLFPDYDKEKWHRAAVAADEALQYCLEGGKSLVSGANNQGTPMLNTMRDIAMSSICYQYENNEVLLAFNRKQQAYNYEDMYRVPQIPNHFFSGRLTDNNAQGCIGASIKMVRMFYTEHGLPLEEDRQWLSSPYTMSKEGDSRYLDVIPLNTDVLTLHRRREPRFYADIAADGTYWVLQNNSSSGSADNTPYLVNAKCGGAFGSQYDLISASYNQNLSGYWVKKGLNPSVGLLSYTQQSASTSQLMILFRMAEVYLMAAEAWNEYLDQPDQHVYDMINAVRERAGIPDVQTAWHNYALHPDKVDTKDGMREIIQREWNIEFAFEGRRFWNLRRWKTAPEELNQPQYGWNILGTDNRSFYNNYEGPVVVWSKRQFTAPRDYFWPIRAEEILVSGVRQNPGW